jgi:protein NrfD
MALSSVLILFLSHLGIGIAFTLLLVSKDAGIKFFRFNGGLAAILMVIALAFPFATPVKAGQGGGAVSVGISFGWIALVVSTALTVFYWATVGRVLTRFRTAILGLAVVAGLGAIVLEALDLSIGWGMPLRALAVASFLTSAAMLGGACTAMILGHWYLVIPSMQVSHLQSIVRVHIVSMAARIVVVGAAVWFALATGHALDPILGPTFRRYIFSVAGIFFWQRVLFGLAGPAVLSYLTWETAKIRSTQSATGILYVDFFTVVVGEVLAKYITLATHVPV